MNYPRKELVLLTYAVWVAERNTDLSFRIYAQRYPERMQPQSQLSQKLK